MNRISKLIVCFLLLFPPIAKSEDFTKDLLFLGDEVVLGQLVDGAGWKTTITLVNLDTQVASFELLFVADNAGFLTLTLVSESGASTTGSRIQGNIAVGGAITYSTLGTAQELAQGWAVLASSQRIAGQAVFRRALPGFPDIEAVVPFTSLFDLRQVLPFDQTGGFLMGVALTNPATSTLTVTLQFRNSSGTILLQDTMTMQGGTHTAFLLSQKYPQTINQRGVVEITTPGGTLGSTTGVGVGVLGLRGNPSGGLTTVFSVVSVCWKIQC